MNGEYLISTSEKKCLLAQAEAISTAGSPCRRGYYIRSLYFEGLLEQCIRAEKEARGTDAKK